MKSIRRYIRKACMLLGLAGAVTLCGGHHAQANTLVTPQGNASATRNAIQNALDI